MAQSIDGIVLERVLATGARLTEPQVLAIADGVLTGLAQMHAAGRVHGRLGPASVLLAADGGVWIFAGEPPNQAYTAPEQLLGQQPGPASDVYAAAALLAHLARGAVTLPPSAADLDPAFGWLLTPALSVDPAGRPTAGAALEALNGLATQRHGPDWRRAAVLGGVATGVGGATVVVLAGSSGAAMGGVAAGGAAAAGIAATGAGGAAAGGVAAGGAAAGGATAGTAAGGAASGASGVAGVGAGAGSAAQGAVHAQGAAAQAAFAQGSTQAAGHGAGHAVGGGLSKGLLIKAGAALGVGVLGTTAAVVALSGGGSTASHELPATADIYLAGAGDDVAATMSDPGTSPLRIALDGSGKVSFPSVSGDLGACSGCEPEPVDGGNVSFPSTNLTPLNGISGVLHEDRTLFLVGVFLDDGEPDQDDQVDLTDADSEETQEPEIGEVFFIGDGETGDGDLQTIVVPDGAETLYVGFADGYAFVGTPGAYGDNSGSVDLEVTLD